MYVYCMVGRTMYAVNVFEIMNICITSVHFSLPGGVIALEDYIVKSWLLATYFLLPSKNSMA